MTTSPALQELRSARTIRERAGRVLASGLRGELEHFLVDEARLPEVARLVAQTTKERYPDLRVPPHSRFAHFDAGGVPRTAALERELAGLDSLERARRLTELVVVSVLVDAGAGAQWRFTERETGTALGRSEGLAVASLAWAKRGGLSAAGEAYRVDADGLLAVSETALAEAFQVSGDNPLVGTEGRVHLLRSLGRALRTRSDVFGPDARVGGLVDKLTQASGQVRAPDVLALILDALSGIWPGRLTLQGVPLGDVWNHAAAGGEGATAGLLPLHKLSQWLCYSLLHPLAVAGLDVIDVSELTGLAEYRNGGLFIDAGVLTPRDEADLRREHAVSSELVVEWRGLTVALLDRLLPLVRRELGPEGADLSLAAMLEGGSWAAGRALARLRRQDGSPPLHISSDGTVF
ncbi:MAG TPA: DUF1688 family protein [Polyangiales bacterium]|nr:DUF1688 family protein [Polyangiales bacterium]